MKRCLNQARLAREPLPHRLHAARAHRQWRRASSHRPCFAALLWTNTQHNATPGVSSFTSNPIPSLTFSSSTPESHMPLPPHRPGESALRHAAAYTHTPSSPPLFPRSSHCATVQASVRNGRTCCNGLTLLALRLLCLAASWWGWRMGSIANPGGCDSTCPFAACC